MTLLLLLVFSSMNFLLADGAKTANLAEVDRCDPVVCRQGSQQWGSYQSYLQQVSQGNGVKVTMPSAGNAVANFQVPKIKISVSPDSGKSTREESTPTPFEPTVPEAGATENLRSSSQSNSGYNNGYGGTQAARGGMGSGGVQYATGNEGYGAGIAGTAGYKGPKMENVGGFNVVDDGEAQTASQNTNSLAPPPGGNSEIALNKASNDARNRGLAAASVPSSGGGVPSAGSKNLNNGKDKGPGNPDWIGDALEKMKDFAGGFWSANVTEYGQDSKFGAGRKGKRGKKGKGQLSASNAHADPAGALNKRLQLRGLASRLEFGRANEPIFHTMCLQYQEYARKNYIPDDKARCPRD